MSTYLEQVVADKNFVGNVVILIGGQYFAIRQPDSGLVIPAPQDRVISNLVLNPTQIDIRRVSTTIANYSFALADVGRCVSAIVAGTAASFIRQEVEIYLGRSNFSGDPSKDMDFADYYKLPTTRVTKATFADNSYKLTSSEDTERMQRPIYTAKSRLAGDILFNTTTITATDPIDAFPSSGVIKIDKEFISYTSKNNVARQFLGCVRGVGFTFDDAHEEGADIFHAERVTGNPIDTILKILTSGGGGGAYDVLQSGLGIDQSLIDIAAFEAKRDELFFDKTFELDLYNIDSALKYIESQLLEPLNIRFSVSQAGKISLAVLDKAVFIDDEQVIDEDTITKFPQWDVDGNRILNNIILQWHFDEALGEYRYVQRYSDPTSIATYGESSPITYSFDGVRDNYNGQIFIEKFALHFLTRVANPMPEIEVTTQIDKSLFTIGDKAEVISSEIPSFDGSLEFAQNLEIISRAINYRSADVKFRLAFTSFTGLRSCFIAPSDSIQAVTNQKTVSVAAGRGVLYKVGWKMRLFDISSNAYTADAVNEIASIAGDVITFVNDFTTVLTGPNDFRIKFADYDEVIEQQKKYCFVSAGPSNFYDGTPPYQITY